MYNKEISKILAAIKERRLALNYTQTLIADKLQITQNVYSKIESNKIKLTACRLSQICEVLEMDVVILLKSV